MRIKIINLELCELLESLDIRLNISYTLHQGQSAAKPEREGSTTRKFNNPEGNPVGGKMFNKDKRSLLLSLALGDGCLHYIKNNNKVYGGLTIDHGIEQADYQSWKAALISDIFGKQVKMRPGHNGKSVQVSVCMKRLRAWRKFTYPNGKKSIPKILKYIRHPEFALAVWLMDDGYIEPGMYNKKLVSVSTRIFVCDQAEEEVLEIQRWFRDNFNIETKVLYQRKGDKKYPFIKFYEKDALSVWHKIRDVVLQFKSMQHKFRHIENIYQLKFSQRTTE